MVDWVMKLGPPSPFSDNTLKISGNGKKWFCSWVWNMVSFLDCHNNTPSKEVPSSFLSSKTKVYLKQRYPSKSLELLPL